MFQSTKKIGPISTCHRNWKAASNPNRNSKKCAYIHGYSRWVEFTFQGELDCHQWVQDFGDCRFIKEFLEKEWDHRVLVAGNDPELETLGKLHEQGLIDLNVIPFENGWGPGIEGSAKYVFDHIQPILTEKTNGRVRIAKIEIWEHDHNSASFVPEDSDF